MKNLMRVLLMCGVFWGGSVQAQSVVWGFDDDNNEVYIPAQCDGQFDEENGGVFVPTPVELFNQGELFLNSGDKAQQSSAGYCFMSAALQGYVPAQYRLAQLYEKGIGVPQNDLTAYKWAYTASLSGDKEAARLALMLEQYLTAEDIELATKDVQTVIPQIKAVTEGELQIADRELNQKKEKLESINQEIDALLGIPPQKPVKVASAEETSAKENKPIVGKTVSPRKKIIFNEKDRLK